MTEPADIRPRAIIPIHQLEQLAMAIDFAYAQALDPKDGLPMVLPAAKIAELFPDWKDAGPQEVSLITAMIVLEWLSGHKVISRGGIDKRRPRSSKPPTASAEGKPAQPMTPSQQRSFTRSEAEAFAARLAKRRQSMRCGHCGALGLLPGESKCMWCGEKSGKHPPGFDRPDR